MHLVVADDCRRSRLTVVLRPVLVQPHVVWLAVWTVVAVGVALVQWPVVVARGRPVAALHGFLTRFVRYGAHVQAYSWLASDPFPEFQGRAGSYPVDVVVGGPGVQRRWTALLRPVLAFPPLVFASLLGEVTAVVAFFAWFTAAALGRTPRGMRDLVAYCVRFEQQAVAYVAFVTDRYPTFASAEVYVAPAARWPQRARERVALASPARRLAAFALDVVFAVLSLVVGWLVWSLVVWKRGQSPGKHILQLRALDAATGERTSWRKTAFREVVCKLLVGGAAAASVLGLVLWAWLLWDDDRQQLWDKLAGTVVVDARATSV